jgi:site-specific recombinase XerD
MNERLHYKFVHARKGFKDDGTALVQLRVTLNRKSKFFSTGINVKEHQFQEPGNIVAHPKKVMYNNLLRELTNKLENYEYSCNSRNIPLSLDAVQKLINNQNYDSFTAFCESLVYDTRLRSETHRQLKSFVNLIKEFGRIETFADVNIETIREFDNWLFKRKYNVNTIRKKHALLRRYINKAIDAGHIADNPYSRFKLPRPVEVRRKFLSREHLHAIIEKEMPNQRLDTVKDMFLFSCFTGLAYSDVRKLTPKDFYTYNGTMFIITNRSKTDEESAIPLMPQAAAIVQKYNDPESDRLLPIPSNQRMNSYLKEIQALCNIPIEMTTHVARHTFATTVTLENGVPIETVSRMLGHADLSTTQIYARITRQKLADDMAKLTQKLSQKE